MKLGDMPAFPGEPMLGPGQPGARRTYAVHGMTLRQYYAGLAMQALLTGVGGEILLRGTDVTMADHAVRLADALLAELDTGGAK